MYQKEAKTVKANIPSNAIQTIELQTIAEKYKRKQMLRNKGMCIDLTFGPTMKKRSVNIEVMMILKIFCFMR